MGDCIRVLIADDDRMTRRSLAELVAGDAGLHLVGTAEDAEQAVTLARQQRPDVALLDVHMPGGGGVAAARGIARNGCGTRVVALSGTGERSAVVEMLQAGAVGYLVKGTPVGELLESIRRTARGERALSDSVVAEIADELSAQLAAQEFERIQRAEREASIRRIIDNGLVTMVFQPIVDVASGDLTAVEALARFESEPRQGPHIWFEHAEEAGLREELELAAIRSALTAPAKIPPHARLSLNVSPATVLTGSLDELLGPAAAQIIVEITEHAAVEDYDRLGAALQPLRTAGMQLAIDDAGAGFASLRHILRLAPDIIKIDMSLTQHVVSDRASRALTSALVLFAAEIGATVVAEGVESANQLTALRELGVGHAQGYHLGRPVALEEIRAATARPVAA